MKRLPFKHDEESFYDAVGISKELIEKIKQPEDLSEEITLRMLSILCLEALLKGDESNIYILSYLLLDPDDLKDGGVEASRVVEKIEDKLIAIPKEDRDNLFVLMSYILNNNG